MTERCCVKEDGFYGRYAPAARTAGAAILVVTDDAVDGIGSKSFVRWLHGHAVPALAVSPEKGQRGCHSYPLEQIEQAVAYLKARGHAKVGILGISASGMTALTAASLLPDITLTVALTPSDFVMEGYYQDRKDGAAERPGDGESSLTWRGGPLPFLPYAYRHPEYWAQLRAEARRRGSLFAARDMFDESERRHPLREEERVRVERIRGHIYLAAAEDDALWDAGRYIRRMAQRLETLPHECSYETHLYRHGTHFVFPDGMVRSVLPLGADLLLPLAFREGRGHARECRQTRRDIDRTLLAAIQRWADTPPL